MRRSRQSKDERAVAFVIISVDEETTEFWSIQKVDKEESQVNLIQKVSEVSHSASQFRKGSTPGYQQGINHSVLKGSTDGRRRLHWDHVGSPSPVTDSAQSRQEGK